MGGGVGGGDVQFLTPGKAVIVPFYFSTHPTLKLTTHSQSGITAVTQTGCTLSPHLFDPCDPALETEG